MEDEGRPLPDGWVRQYDAAHSHQFFVDTRANPPRSIWHHPYDDEEFLSTLSSEEHERIQSLHRVPTSADLLAESSDEEDGSHHHHAQPSKSSAAVSSSAAASGSAAASSSTGRQSEQLSGVHKFGRKMKDKVTQTSHEQREAERKQRAERERRDYETHLAFRRCMTQAMQTGQPQYFGRDPNGKDVYIEPPGGMRQGYTADGRMVNPYSQGPYANPNARFIRPQTAYQRPYGYGYGGGYGLPLAGGLAGGLLLGGALGGIGGFGF